MLTLKDIADRIDERAKIPERALDSRKLCAYRGGNGLACFVGCLIPDALYTPEIEGRGLGQLKVEGRWLSTRDDPRLHLLAVILNESGIPATSSAIDFMRESQVIHDLVVPEDWAEELSTLRRKFNV